MIDWLMLWEMVKGAFGLLSDAWTVFIQLVFLFGFIGIWRLCSRLDKLVALYETAKEMSLQEKPFIPAEFRETMQKHERAVKRLREGK